MVGTADCVLIKEVSLIQSVLYREVPLYVCTYACTYVLTLRWSELSALYVCSVGELCLPFIQCPVCRREFMSADFLQSHIGRRHPDHLSSKVKCVCVRACVCVSVHMGMCVHEHVLLCASVCCVFIPSADTVHSTIATSLLWSHV